MKQRHTRRPAAAKTTKATKPAPRCELCGRHEVQAYGLCATCLTGKHRRSA